MYNNTDEMEEEHSTGNAPAHIVHTRVGMGWDGTITMADVVVWPPVHVHATPQVAPYPPIPQPPTASTAAACSGVSEIPWTG